MPACFTYRSNLDLWYVFLVFTIVGVMGSLLFWTVFIKSSYLLIRSRHAGKKIVPLYHETAQSSAYSVSDASTAFASTRTPQEITNSVESGNGIALSDTPESLESQTQTEGNGQSQGQAQASISIVNSEVPDTASSVDEDEKTNWSAYYQRLETLQQPLLFILVFAVSIYGTCEARWHLYATRHQSDVLFDQWTDCMFDQFYNGYTATLNTSSVTYTSDFLSEESRTYWAHYVCGGSPPSLVQKYEILWFYVGIFGHPLVAALIFLKPKNVQKFCCKCGC